MSPIHTTDGWSCRATCEEGKAHWEMPFRRGAHLIPGPQGRRAPRVGSREAGVASAPARGMALPTLAAGRPRGSCPTCGRAHSTPAHPVPGPRPPSIWLEGSRSVFSWAQGREGGWRWPAACPAPGCSGFAQGKQSCQHGTAMPPASRLAVSLCPTLPWAMALSPSRAGRPLRQLGLLGQGIIATHPTISSKRPRGSEVRVFLQQSVLCAEW